MLQAEIGYTKFTFN